MEKVNSEKEIIDLNEFSGLNKKPPVGKKYQVQVDHDNIIFDKEKVTGREILEKACKTPVECFSLYQKLKGCDFEKISLNDIVDLTTPGIEHFVTKPPEVFFYDIDDEPETTDQKEMTPNQILAAAAIDYSNHYLVQVNDDGSQINYRDKGNIPIKMRCPKQKFISVLNGPTPVS